MKVAPALGTTFAAAVLATASMAQVTELVSVDSTGTQANFNSTLPPPGRFVSADGRFVAFCTDASNLVQGDTNGTLDIFVRDRVNRTTARVSVGSTGVQGNSGSGSYGISISADGRFVAFESAANNLVSGDTNGASDVFVHDRATGITERISMDSSGLQANGASHYPSLSADARYVAFASSASNLVPGDNNGKWDVFVRDRLAGWTERVSTSTAGLEADRDSYKPEVSADGRCVAFVSSATNLIAGDTNAAQDVFLHDRLTGTTELVSVASSGGHADSTSSWPAVSDNGRYVAFWSSASNLVGGDTNGMDDVFLRDRRRGITLRVSVATGGSQSYGHCGFITISGDGGCIAFQSSASDLVSNDTNPVSDIFVRDVRAGTTERVSVSTAGSQVSGPAYSASISASGRYIAFLDVSSDLVSGDTNGYADMFIHDRFAAGFTSMCHPASNSVIACPCGNQPSSLGRGCDNSSFTGGSVLAASGIAYLSIDSLVFTTSDEKPGATSILLQGTTSVPAGLVFGQGVRCVGGAMRRLYVKTAANGSIAAPDLSAGDPSVSARSAALGDPIQSGESRYYLVYYRDPIVLGGCNATSTFNSTQTGSATWWP